MANIFPNESKSMMASREIRRSQVRACSDPKTVKVPLQELFALYKSEMAPSDAIELQDSERDLRFNPLTYKLMLNINKYFPVQPTNFYVGYYSLSFLETGEPDLSVPRHASIFFQYFLPDGTTRYLHISHQEKGAEILGIYYTEGDPMSGSYLRKNKYSKKLEPYYKYTEFEGPILCRGPVKKGTTNETIVDRVLRWWYTMDYQGGYTKSKFPSSCTGLTETMIYWFAGVKCPQIKGMSALNDARKYKRYTFSDHPLEPNEILSENTSKPVHQFSSGPIGHRRISRHQEQECPKVCNRPNPPEKCRVCLANIARSDNQWGFIGNRRRSIKSKSSRRKSHKKTPKRSRRRSSRRKSHKKTPKRSRRRSSKRKSRKKTPKRSRRRTSSRRSRRRKSHKDS